MKILFVGTLPERGGAASHLVALATALGTAGHTVTVVATEGSVIWEGLGGAEGVSRIPCNVGISESREARDSLRRLVGAHRPDEIISVFERDYLGSAWVARRAGIGHTLFMHHAGMRANNRTFLRVLPLAFLAPSHDLADWLTTERRIPKRRVRVLYNPVDTAHFSRDEAARRAWRSALGVADDETLVGYAGRFEENKGILPYAEALLDAMDRDARLRSVWMGFGSVEGALRERLSCSPHATRHVFRPWSDDVRSFYSAIDVLSLPSVGRESFGRVLIEAQSCGVPVLGSRRGGIVEALEDGVSGMLVKAGDTGAWSDAIVALAASPARRRAMGSAGRAFVERRFAAPVIVRDFESLFARRAR